MKKYIEEQIYLSFMLPFCVTHIVILLRLEEHKLSFVYIKLT